MLINDNLLDEILWMGKRYYVNSQNGVVLEHIVVFYCSFFKKKYISINKSFEKST